MAERTVSWPASVGLRPKMAEAPDSGKSQERSLFHVAQAASQATERHPVSPFQRKGDFVEARMSFTEAPVSLD